MTDKNKKLEYVLITPAKNEADNIEHTINSVITQIHLPLRWVIVDDNSYDKTGEIILKYTKQFEWIQLITRNENDERHFAAKVFAFNAGYELIKNLDFDIVGNLDADLSFENDYFDYLVHKFIEDPRLGVAGTPFMEDGRITYDYRFTNIEHVSGACQLFRKACFKDIKGYTPIKQGGIDWVAVTTARMKGWKTRTFPEKQLIHHRKMGTAGVRSFFLQYKIGKKDYLFGNHPIWELFRILYQMKNEPYIIGSLLMLLGYGSSFIRRIRRPISQDLIYFIRHEQLKRLKSKMYGIIYK